MNEKFLIYWRKKADNFNDPVIPMDVLRTTKDELSQLYDLFKCSNLGQKVLIDPGGKFGMHDSATVDVEDCCYCRDRNLSHPR